MANRLVMSAHERSHSDGSEIHDLVVQVPMDLRWIRGHFDGNPILPAVVQLLEALTYAGEIWPDLPGLRRVTQAKFRKPIRPEDVLRLRLQRRSGARSVAFEYQRAGVSCSSGVLEFTTGTEPRID